MKGLILKDIIQIWKNYKILLLIELILVVFGAFSGNLFMSFYGTLLLGILPYSSMTFDDTSRWNIYCLTMPFSRTQIVSSKYMLTVILCCAAELVSVISYIVSYVTNHSDTDMSIRSMIIFPLAFTLLFTAINFPLIFKLGTGKARIAALILSGAAAGFASTFFITSDDPPQPTTPPITSAAALIAVVTVLALFCVSWLLSIKIYQKKEL
ncbi:MAG: ABC-2 transporter permease [Ruminococcus sp.]|nr:ABC-2 transporter permease [Ruminococcus sp.]